jgi:hypothetical protein
MTWCESVEAEVEVAEGYEPGLIGLRGSSWLGPPLTLKSTRCLRDVARLQRILAAHGDPPTKHLGEAESIHVIEHELDGHGVLATDDGSAEDLAQRRGLSTLRTDEILRECFHMDDLRCPEPFDLLEEMFEAGRDNISVPPDHSYVC